MAGQFIPQTFQSTVINAFIVTKISIPLRWRNRMRFICRLSWWPVRGPGSRLTRHWNNCWTIPEKPGFFKISPRRRLFYYVTASPPRIWSIFILWRCQKMKNKGCAFEVQGGGTSRYFTSPLDMASRILSAFSMKTGVKRAMRLCRCTSGYRRPHRFPRRNGGTSPTIRTPAIPASSW